MPKRLYIVGHDHGCPALGTYSKRGCFVAVRNIDALPTDVCRIVNVEACNKRDALRIAREHPQYFCKGYQLRRDRKG